MRTALTPLTCALLLIGCTGPTTEAPPTEAPPGVDVPDTPADVPDDTEPIVTLSPRAWLARASLDLRGRRPSLEELDAIDADPDSLAALIGGFVQEPAFGTRVNHLFTEVFQARHELPFVDPDYHLANWSKNDLNRSIGEEPTRMLGYIAIHDLSYAEMVTADWTMANEVLADMWPVTYDPDAGTRWQHSHYTDDRPAAGVLSGNGMWWQFGSMENNLNRGRANQVSRIFLCSDYLDRQVDFGTNQPLNSDEALGDAIRTDPACTSCHDSLDPLAAHFFGFWVFEERRQAPHDHATYHTEREQEWRTYDMPRPAFNGEPTAGLADFGQKLARDPRYASCFVRQTFHALMRRAPTTDDTTFLSEKTDFFRDHDMRLQPLFNELATSEYYGRGEGEHSRKLVDPALLSSMIFDLTGYRLSIDAWDLVRAPIEGFFPLAGGVDGIHRDAPMSEPETTFLLVNKRLAEAAASYAVGKDFEDFTQARLLTEITGDEDPVADRDVIVDQLITLHARILSERVTADHPDVLQELQLFTDLLDASGLSYTAWAGVISLMMRDPAFVTY